jgi:hypothetical protein
VIYLQALVQMPDGTYQYRPVAVNTYKRVDGELRWVDEIREFDSDKEARDWAEFILHEKVRVGYDTPTVADAGVRPI